MEQIKVTADLINYFSEKFGANNLKEVDNDGQPLLLINTKNQNGVQYSLILTTTLSDYAMPIPDKADDSQHVELYFCLPTYWDVHDLENPNMNWIFHWIKKLQEYVVKKETWYGHGHTMACGKEMNSLSPTMKQNHFILSKPILAEDSLATVELDGRHISFLAIVPIFGDEMDYKQGKGTAKLFKKLKDRNVDEKLDDYRSSVLKSNWRWNR